MYLLTKAPAPTFARYGGGTIAPPNPLIQVVLGFWIMLKSRIWDNVIQLVVVAASSKRCLSDPYHK
jgi:hypothetical protein